MSGFADLPVGVLEKVVLQLGDALPRFRATYKAIRDATDDFKDVFTLDLEQIEATKKAANEQFEPFVELQGFPRTLVTLFLAGRSDYLADHPEGDDTFSKFIAKAMRDEGSLAKLRTVRCLYLERSPVTTRDLSLFCHLCPSLSMLSIGHKYGEYGTLYVEAGALAVLRFLPNLRCLGASCSSRGLQNPAGDDIPALRDVSLLTQLTRLDVQVKDCAEDKLEIVVDAVAGITGLRSLDLTCASDHQRDVSFECMSRLEPLTHLTRLKVDLANVDTRDLLAHAATGCTQLELLQFVDFSDEGMIVSSNDLALLTAMPRLVMLVLDGVSIPDDDVPVPPMNRKLCVDVTGAIDVASLRKLLPVVRILSIATSVVDEIEHEREELMELAAAADTVLVF